MKVKVATLLACDFCGKDETALKELIKGPKDVCICDECVDVCIRILAEKVSRPHSHERPGVTIEESSRARVLPSVSWWHVIVEMERHGYTHAAMAAAIGSSRGTVEGWKNKAASPRHEDGERMIALWRVVTGKAREDVPVKTDDILSAASFR